MFDLLHTFPGDFNFLRRCLLRLPDEGVEHHDATTYKRAEENPADAFRTFQAELKQAITEGIRVRRTEIGTYRCHAARQDDISRSDGVWQVKNLLLDFLAVVLNRVVREQIITNMLIDCKRYTNADSGKPNARVERPAVSASSARTVHNVPLAGRAPALPLTRSARTRS